MSGTSVEQSCSKALASNSPNRSQPQAVSSLWIARCCVDSKALEKGHTGWVWSLPASKQGAKSFLLGHSIWSMVQLLNIIDLQIGKVVTSLSGLHYKFPRVPPLSLAGTPAPRCYFISAGLCCRANKLHYTVLCYKKLASSISYILGVHCLSKG